MLELQHKFMGDFEKDFFDCYARSLPYLIEKASVYIRLKGALLLNELGADITLEQFITLDAISSCDDLSQRDLARILIKDRSNITRILNILEKKDLIYRKLSKKGNRMVKVAGLTKQGKDVVDEYSEKMKSDLNEFLSQFDQQNLEILKKTLEEISLKIRENANIQI